MVKTKVGFRQKDLLIFIQEWIKMQIALELKKGKTLDESIEEVYIKYGVIS